MTIENPDKEGDVLLPEIKDNLKKLDRDIREKGRNKIDKGIVYLIESQGKELGIPSKIVGEYIKILSDFCVNNKIQDIMDYKLKKRLGFQNLKFPIFTEYYLGIFLFYVKKLCPNNFENIIKLIQGNPGLIMLLRPKDGNNDPYNQIILLGDTKSYPLKDFIKFLEKHGDLSYHCLKFCSPFNGSYIQNSIALINGKDEHSEIMGKYSMIVQFFENFIKEPEASNLMMFLMGNPQKLRNLGGKQIKEIDLNVNLGINFTFRGILEMVKSRPDLDFPHLKENASDKEKQQWKQQWKIIIKEYENMLRNYISKDFHNGKSDSKSENTKKPFDKIFFSAEHGDKIIDEFIVIKDEIQKFSGNKVLDYSIQTDKDIISNSRIDIQNIKIKGTGIEKEYQSLNYAEKLSFINGFKEIKKEGYIYKIYLGNLIREKALNNSIEPAKKEIFSDGKWRVITGSLENKKIGKKMLSDIENYVREHPQEKILVCIDHHGGPDGSSGNGWTKEDWIRIAKLSPNLKIWTVRCFFGKALENKNIYNYNSSVSGFSNESISEASIGNIINSGIKKGLGFNELEIYARLNYPMAATPLSENMEYKNIKTGKTEIGKTGLAQNDNQYNSSDVNYA